MIRKEFLTLPIGDIHPYKGNPRRIGKDAVDAVIASIKDCENLDPIEVDENNIILSGHTSNGTKARGYERRGANVFGTEITGTGLYSYGSSGGIGRTGGRR